MDSVGAAVGENLEAEAQVTALMALVERDMHVALAAPPLFPKMTTFAISGYLSHAYHVTLILTSTPFSQQYEV